MPSPLPAKTRRRLVLLPGSRTAELERHWEPMARAAQSLASRLELEIVAVRASGLADALFRNAAERSIRVVDSGLHSLLATADLVFVASGTATLEAAICGAPMVVVYKTSPASFAVAKLLVTVPWISLVNLVAQERVVPELVQGEFNAERLEREGEALLSDPIRVARMREGLARVARSLGPSGASERAADAVLEALEGSSTTAARA